MDKTQTDYIEKKEAQIWRKIRAAVLQVTKSKNMSIRSVASKIGLGESAYRALANSLSGTRPSRMNAGRLGHYLDALDIDLASLILDHELHLDNLPTAVRSFLSDEMRQNAMTHEEIKAIYWLARTGWFDKETTEHDLKTLWLQMRDKAKAHNDVP